MRLAALWALAVFLGLNSLLWQIDKDSIRSKNLWNGTGSIDLTVNAFNKLSEAPTVVLLGSSLMMYPFWTMDKYTLGDIPDIFHHHQSAVLAKQLELAGVPTAGVFSFAIFGQMVSDAYIYVNEFLKGEKAPEFIVYGIAPRDFSDSDLASPMVTNTFKRLVTLSNFPRYAGLYLPGLTDKADFVLSRVCYFYEKRWRLQQELCKALEKGYKSAGLEAPPTRASGQEGAGFMALGRKEDRWKNSEREYSRRYKNIQEKDLSIQMGFLERLLATCRQRNIKVVLVNMPLAPDNRKLLPPAFYSSFREQVTGIAARYEGVRFIDLGEAPEFTTGDFWDTAHLEHGGGFKLLRHLTPILCQMKKR